MRMAEKYKKKALELVERTEKTLLEIKNRAKKHEEDEKKAREDNDYAKERILRICTCDITLINAQCTCHYCMEDPYGPHTCYGCGTCYSYIEDLDERLIKTNRAALYASDKEGIVMSPYKSAYERLVKSTPTSTPESQRIYSTSSPNTLPDIDDSLLSKSMLASSLTDLLNVSSIEDILNRTILLNDSIEEKENAIEEEENVVGNKKIASCDDVTLEDATESVAEKAHEVTNTVHVEGQSTTMAGNAQELDTETAPGKKSDEADAVAIHVDESTIIIIIIPCERCKTQVQDAEHNKEENKKPTESK